MTPAQIKSARAQLGLTQKALASALGVSCRAVQEWENGNRNIMRPAVTVIMLALKYGIEHITQDFKSALVELEKNNQI